ncbi:hypothetical protein ACFW9I_36855 [[Kitasatospora] papulosa]|uniref:hypothetical protein n=1 Tax=[Kitasatospora] papulosa TaxID=1464011 RepID=UPI0036BDA89C
MNRELMVRAWVPNEWDDVLLTRVEGRLQLPGGPAVAASTNEDAVIEHVRAQTGLNVVPLRPIATDRWTAGDGPDSHHVIYLCAHVPSAGLMNGSPLGGSVQAVWAGENTPLHGMAPTPSAQFATVRNAWAHVGIVGLTDGRTWAPARALAPARPPG